MSWEAWGSPNSHDYSHQDNNGSNNNNNNNNNRNNNDVIATGMIQLTNVTVTLTTHQGVDGVGLEESPPGRHTAFSTSRIAPAPPPTQLPPLQPSQPPLMVTKERGNELHRSEDDEETSLSFVTINPMMISRMGDPTTTTSSTANTTNN